MAEAAPSAASNFSTTIQQTLPALLQAYRENVIFRTQMKRAEKGLAPLAVEEYSPPVRVQAGIDPKTLLLIGGGIAAVVVTLLVLKRRK